MVGITMGIALTVTVLFTLVIVSAIYAFNKIQNYKDDKKCWEKKYTMNLQSKITIREGKIKLYEDYGFKSPRMTFERFLNLYNISPHKWFIETDEYNVLHNFPVYIQEEKGKKTIIPVYWENQDELKKYFNWVEEQFEKGEAAVYQKARDESFKQLVDFVQQDIEDRLNQIQKDYDKIKEETTKEKEDKGIVLRLSDGTEVPVKK